MKKFLQGILFKNLFIPLLDNILSLSSQLTELLCIKIALKSYNLKKQMVEDNNIKENTCAISFHYDPEPEDEYYDDEEEEE